MHVLSIDQPYASLIMQGVKRFETRPAPPNGDMRPDGVRGLPGPAVNRGDRLLIASTRRPAHMTEPLWYGLGAAGFIDEGASITLTQPLGYILGSVTVTDALPIEVNTYCEFEAVDRHVCIYADEVLTLVDHDLGDSRISGQLPFGDWQRGRWAWELADALSTTERCPWCDGAGSVPALDPLSPDMTAFGEPLDPCPICDCEENCDPIPVTGRQGVWAWNGEVADA